MDVGGDVSEAGEIARVEIGDAEQAGVTRRHLCRIRLVLEARPTPVEPREKARIVGVEDQDAHRACCTARTWATLRMGGVSYPKWNSMARGSR